MSIEKRTERNTKQRERYNITKSAGLTFQSPVLDTKEPCFTQEFGLAPAIDEKDEVSRESIKKERDRKRYAEMPPLLRHEKIVKTNEGRRQKNNYLTGEQINTPVTGNLQSVLTQQQSPPLNKFDSGLWEPDDPMHGVEENDFDQLNPEDYGPADIEDDEARVFHHQDFQYQYAVDTDIGYRGSDPYDAVYKDLPKKHHVLKKAKKLSILPCKEVPGEGPAFCYRKGKVNIYIPEIPVELRRLFASQTDNDAKYFRKHIRYFNSHFSFTSFGVSIDHNLASARGTGVYCFKAHGQIYHRLDQLIPGGRGPRHMQLYFYDTD